MFLVKRPQRKRKRNSLKTVTRSTTTARSNPMAAASTSKWSQLAAETESLCMVECSTRRLQSWKRAAEKAPDAAVKNRNMTDSAWLAAPQDPMPMLLAHQQIPAAFAKYAGKTVTTHKIASEKSSRNEKEKRAHINFFIGRTWNH